MDSIKLWARDGEAVHQAIELGEIAHMETASEELTDEFLLFAIESGLLKTWAEVFPDPRSAPEIGMEVILPAHLAARFAGLYSMRKAGYVLRSARVLGALGYSVEVKVRERASRRAVKQAVDAAEAEARAQQVAAQLVSWYNQQVGVSLLQYARLGRGRRIHILDTTHVEVPLETGTYECSGVVKNEDG